MKKRYHIRLFSTQAGYDIDRLQRAIQAEQDRLRSGMKTLVRKAAERGEQYAREGFATAVYDGLQGQDAVSVEASGEYSMTVRAEGPTAHFIEFGTGVKFPDNHPEAAKLGMTRGGYGHGLGRLKGGWRYTGDPGSNGEVITSGPHAGEVHTYGNPANMPMYESAKQVREDSADLIEAIFDRGGVND